MKKSMMLILALVLISSMAMAQNVLVFSTEGEFVNCGFVKIENHLVFLNIDGQITTVDPKEIAVLIFDNGFTNYYKDRDFQGQADPNTIVMKRDQNYYGRVFKAYPNGVVSMSRSAGGFMEIPIDQVARIYFNPRPFFESAKITGNNSIEWDYGETTAKPADKKKSRKKNKTKINKPKAVQKLGGGMACIQFRNSSSTTGIIFDAQGKDLELILNDGRKFRVSNIKMINYEEVKFNYPGENKYKKPGYTTFILRGGGVTYGQIIDYRGQGEWELVGGQRVRWNQVKRIYF